MANCEQETRLAIMETALVGIQENQIKLTSLMETVVRSKEHIKTLRAGDADKEQRLRKVEQTMAARGWTERVSWAVVSAGLAGLFSYIKFGGGTK